MLSSSVRQEIENVKNDIINHSLVIASVISVIIYSIGLTYSFQTGFEWSYVTDFIVLLSVILLAIFRKRIRMHLKSYVLLLGLYILVMMDIFEFGINATNVVLIVLVPFFALFSIKTWQSLAILLLFGFTYFGIASMHITGYLEAHDLDFNTTEHWSISFLMILIVMVILVQLVLRFIRTYEMLIMDLIGNKQQLEGYKDRLEILVDERTRNLSDRTQELEKAYESLKSTQNQLIQSDKMASLGLFASGVAHEINNPLNFIKSGIQVTEDLLKKSSKKEELYKILATINSGVDRAADIVSSLSMYSRTTESKEEPCQINDIIAHSVTILNNQMNGETTLHFEQNRDLPEIRGNTGKLLQAFVNIIHNAIQACQNQGTIKIETYVERNFLITNVVDSGMGISSDNLDKVKEPFFTTKEVGSGTGLGLFITHNIIEEHKGTLAIESTVGKGTKVKVALPLIV